jgi:adenine-specific DNA-methyltransferase
MCCTIDDVEQKTLSQLIESEFGELVGTVSIRIKPSGRPIPNGFALSHEYAIFARVNPAKSIARLEHSEAQRNRYKENDEKGAFFWEMFRKAGSNSNRGNRPTMYFPFFLDKRNQKIRLPEMSFDEATQTYIIHECPQKNEVTVYPTKDDGSEGVWYFGYERAKMIVNELKAEMQGDNQYHLYYRRRPNEGAQPTTICQSQSTQRLNMGLLY